MKPNYPHKLLILFLMVCLGGLQGIAFGGDFDSDVDSAIGQIKKDQLKGKDKEYGGYEKALRSYNSARNESFSCMLDQLRNSSPDTDVSSNWRGCADKVGRALGNLKADFLLTWKDHNPEDYSLEKIGPRDFFSLEEKFASALGNNVALPEARHTILFLTKRTRDAINDLESKWNELDKKAQEVDSGRKDAAGDLRRKADEALNTLDKVADLPEFPGGELIKVLNLLNQAYPAARAFWFPYKTKDRDVFDMYKRTKSETDAMMRSQIRVGIIQEALSKAESGTSTSALTDRRDYVSFRGKAMDILRGYADKAKAANDELVSKNKGRFIERLSSSNSARIVDQDLYDRERANLKDKAERIDKLIQKLEDKAQSSKASDDVKRQVKELKEWRPYYKLYEEWEREYIERRSLSRPAEE